MIMDIAFAVVPTILGLGAAGLLGSGIINTAREVRNSISLLKTVGPMMQAGWMAGKGLNTLRKGTAERLQQSGNPVLKGVGIGLAPIQFVKSKKKNQDTQDKQEGQAEGGSGGGGGGTPPVLPDIKSDKQEERPKPTGIDTYSPISIPNPFKKKE
jgi:hypothetical protein